MLEKLGNVVELNLRLNIDKIHDEIAPFKTEWKTYNPRKQGYGRTGLSLTSLDGGLSGIPDLDSVKEFNQNNGTKYSEKSFKTPTAVVKNSIELSKLFDTFQKNVSRSHIIKFSKGGFFPPHRDSFVHAETFRLFSVLSDARATDFYFILDNQIQFFRPGSVYYINTILAHSIFSFIEGLKILVMNIDLNEEAIRTVHENLVVR